MRISPLSSLFLPLFLFVLLQTGANAELGADPQAAGQDAQTIEEPAPEEQVIEEQVIEEQVIEEQIIEEEFDEPDFSNDEGRVAVYDPIEPFNRAMFYFNDKVYFYALKPAARGYSFVVPQGARVGVRRFFSNITTPIRFVNSLLQFKGRAAGTELARFMINTTVGVLGFMDPARDRWQIYKKDEDFGQTLGVYGAGPGIYITWPFLGPSNIRDTIGFAGDIFLDPVNYLDITDLEKIGIHAYDRVNETSLQIGLYEKIKESSVDPYTFIRDAYDQHRRSKIKE